MQSKKKNRKRDAEVNIKLKKMGFRVMRFWDDEINRNPSKCVEKVSLRMSSDRVPVESHWGFELKAKPSSR